MRISLLDKCRVKEHLDPLQFSVVKPNELHSQILPTQGYLWVLSELITLSHNIPLNTQSIKHSLYNFFETFGEAKRNIFQNKSIIHLLNIITSELDNFCGGILAATELPSCPTTRLLF